MGKATIISGGEEGLYKIRVNLHRDNIEATIARMQAEISALEEQVEVIDEQLIEIDAQINAIAADPMAQSTKISARMAIYIKKTTLEIKIKALQRRIAYLEESMPEDPEIDAWCADFSEDLTGAVGTVEVPGERGTVLIRPGFESASHVSERDGVLEPAIAADPAGACYNWAMLPGWQKWKPTHRFGKITSLNGLTDRCNLELEDIPSSAQALKINQTETLSSVPIEYMDGNSEAFEAGDDVLIEFANQDWSTPCVIGFKDHPRDCDFHERFGDRKEPTDYPWNYKLWQKATNIYKGYIQKNIYLTGSSLSFSIVANIPARTWPTDIQLEWHTWETAIKPKKLKRYTVITTQNIVSVNNTKFDFFAGPVASGPGIANGEMAYPLAGQRFRNIFNYPGEFKRVFVLDLYENPPLAPTFIVPHPDNRINSVNVWCTDNASLYDPTTFSMSVVIDTIRITDNPPPPEESIWL